MDSDNRRLILVTGLPRSGTTVVGDVLATAARTTSLYEPMNFQSGDYRFNSGFPVCGSNDFSQADFEKFLLDMKTNQLNLRLGLFPHDSGFKAFAKLFTGGRSRVSYLKTRLSPFSRNVIWKDPFAVFCAEPAAVAGLSVVVTYRPPEAIAASYKRLGWSYDTQHLCSRMGESVACSHLVKDTTFGCQQGISNPVLGAVILWKLSMEMLLESISKGIDLILVSTGDLPDNAQFTMPCLIEKLKLTPTTKTQRLIESRFQKKTDQASVPQGHPHTQRRDLSSVNTYWKKVLSPKEVDFVRSHCDDLRIRIDTRLRKNQAEEQQVLSTNPT